MFLDNALAFDLETRVCDLVFDGTDLALETTPATAMLIALGCARRARPDDVVPSGATNFYTPGTLLARQGWPGDAFDAQGYLIGSRLWLLDGAKGAARTNTTTGPGETTRRNAEAYAAEALEIFEDKGLSTGVTASWKRPGGLLLNAAVGDTTQEISLVFG